jgi:hypothetical protein
MKDIETLLKQAELFEKLAVFGDRRSFLQALAQEAAHGLSPMVLSKLEGLAKDLQFVSVSDELKNKLVDAAAGRLAVEAVRSVLQAIGSSLPPDHAFLQKNVQEILAMLGA